MIYNFDKDMIPAHANNQKSYLLSSKIILVIINAHDDNNKIMISY